MKSDPVVAHCLDKKWRSSDIAINENVDFSGLLLSDKVLSGLRASGFRRPSPIQLQAIPMGRCGLDMIVQAKSGTGKTCVFTVLALENLLESSSATQVLVLAPTREIAIQIQQVVLAIGRHFSDLQCHAFIGGQPMSQDRVNLKCCQVAIGTPGRIKQLIEEGTLKTNSIRTFVLDEADKLLDDAFKADINWIFAHLPESKQMLTASATYPESLAQLLTRYMRDPFFVRLDTKCQELLGISQYFQEVEHHPLTQVVFQNKFECLLRLLQTISFSQCLVFTNYQGRAESLCDVLTKEGWPSVYISGGQEQSKRLLAMSQLKRFKCRVMVSTDLTSRGIDAENVNLVVNFDVPWNPETYLHRIGRAGRFGSRGISLTLVACGKELDDLHTIQKQCFLHLFPLPDLSSVDLWNHDPSSAASREEESKTSEASETSQNSTDPANEDNFHLLFDEPQKPDEGTSYADLLKEETPGKDQTSSQKEWDFNASWLQRLGSHVMVKHTAFWQKVQQKGCSTKDCMQESKELGENTKMMQQHLKDVWTTSTVMPKRRSLGKEHSEHGKVELDLSVAELQQVRISSPKKVNGFRKDCKSEKEEIPQVVHQQSRNTITGTKMNGFGEECDTASSTSSDSSEKSSDDHDSSSLLNERLEICLHDHLCVCNHSCIDCAKSSRGPFKNFQWARRLPTESVLHNAYQKYSLYMEAMLARNRRKF